MKWVTKARPKIDRVACPWLLWRYRVPEPIVVLAAAVVGLLIWPLVGG